MHWGRLKASEAASKTGEADLYNAEKDHNEDIFNVCHQISEATSMFSKLHELSLVKMSSLWIVTSGLGVGWGPLKTRND